MSLALLHVPCDLLITAKTSMRCDLSLSGEIQSRDTAAMTQDCKEIVEYIRLSRKFPKLKLPPSIDVDHPMLDHLDSIQMSPDEEQCLQLYLSCPSDKAFYHLCIMYNTGEMQELLQKILLNEEMREKHSLGDAQLGLNISQEEMKRILPEIQKARQDKSLEMTDLEAGMPAA